MWLLDSWITANTALYSMHSGHVHCYAWWLLHAYNYIVYYIEILSNITVALLFLCCKIYTGYYSNSNHNYDGIYYHSDIVVTMMRQQHQLQMSHHRYSYSHVTMVAYKHVYPARQLCNVSLCVKVYKLATQQIISHIIQAKRGLYYVATHRLFSI